MNTEPSAAPNPTLAVVIETLRMFRKKKLPVLCSFCGKTAEEARKLVAGPGVHICAQCVAVCSKLLTGEPSAHSDERKQSRFLRLHETTNGGGPSVRRAQVEV